MKTFFSSASQLKNQIEKFQKEVRIVHERELTETIASTKETIATYELTTEDLGLADATRGRYGRKAAQVVGCRAQGWQAIGRL